MLSKAKMVAVRAAIEGTYGGACTVTERQKVQRENKSTGFKDVVVLENQPCKLSFSKLASTGDASGAATLIQTAKVLIAPELEIPPGSKLTITQDGVTTDYKKSGVPAVYATHQEIMLALFEGWA